MDLKAGYSRDSIEQKVSQYRYYESEGRITEIVLNRRPGSRDIMDLKAG